MLQIDNTASNSELSGKELFKSLTGLKAVEDLGSSFTGFLGVVSEIDKEFSSITTKMGIGATLTESIKKNLSEGVFEVQKLGGTFADASKIQEEFLDVYGRNVVLQGRLLGDVFATSKVTGQAADKLITSFADAGMSVKDITSEMSTVVDISNQLGVNSQAVSTRVVTNLEKLNRYGFNNGVEGLSRMAAKAAVLRVDMESTFNLADTLFSPEKAIELASSLQRLGAASTELTDPLRLMDLAQNNVPELQKQLGDMFKQYTFFDEKTKKFQIFPEGRRVIRELSSELGFTVGEIEKMALGTSDLDKKLSEISFSGLDINEDTKEMIANMATLGKGGEYEITTKSGDVKTLDEFLKGYQGKEDELSNYFKDMDAAAKATPEEKMRELAEQQLGKLGQIAASSAALSNAFGLSVVKSGAGEKILDVAQTNFDKQSKALIEAIGPNNEAFNKGLSNLGGSIDELVKTLSTGDFMGALDIVERQAGDTLKGVKDSVSEVLKSLGEQYGFNAEELITNFESTIKTSFSALSEGIDGFIEELTNGSGILNTVFTTLKSIIYVDDMYLDPKSNTFIQTDFGKIIPNSNDALLAAPKTQIQSILEGKSPKENAVSNISGDFNHNFTVNITGLSDINNTKMKNELEKLLTVDNGIKNAIVNAAKSSIDNKLNA